MRIPIGNFGTVVAQPAPAPNVPREAFVDGTAGSMEQSGQQLSGIGSGLLNELVKAKTLRTMSESKNDLYKLQDDITQQISEGKLDPEKAQQTWQEQSKKLMDQRLEQISPLRRDLVGAQLQGASLELGEHVHRVAIKRTQQNIGGEITALGISLESESDPAAASSRYDKAVRTMGPSAGWSPAQIEKETNRFREKAYSTQAYTLVNSARNSMPALDNVEKRLQSDEFSALDPQRRAVLLNTTSIFKTNLEQRQVAAARRAEIKAQQHERQAGVVFSKIQALATQGKKIDPEYAASAATALQGTKYAAALPQLLAQAPEHTAFAMQPLSVQKQALDALGAQGNSQGWTPALQARHDELQKSYDASVKDYKSDPLDAAVDRGVLPELAPLDMGDGVGGMLKGLKDRMDQASIVEGQVGHPVSPLTSDEVTQFAGLFKALPVDQQATTMATLSKTVGAPTLGALAAQLDHKDRALALAAAYGDTRLPNGGLVSARILGGQQAIKDKAVNAADLTTWRQDIAEKVRGTYASPEMENAVIDAAVLARADAEVHGGETDVDDIVDNLTGSIVTFNGGRIPLPQGMSEGQFDDAIEKLTPQDLQDQGAGSDVIVAGKAVPIDQFVKELPNATLRHAGQGLYNVVSGTGLAINPDGSPVTIAIGTGQKRNGDYEQSKEKAYARNQAWAKPAPKGGYLTKLSSDDEKKFEKWVKANNVPFDPSPDADYDMRGYWKSLEDHDGHASQGVDPNDGKMHYTDYFKTPYHQTFSRESKWATSAAPEWNDKDQLVTRGGKVIYDDRAANPKRRSDDGN